MGLFDDIMKGARDLAGYEDPHKKEEKPNVLDQAFERVGNAFESAFNQVYDQVGEAAGVEIRLYELADKVASDYRNALGKAGFDLIDEYESRGETLSLYPSDHWRWGHLERERAMARDELLQFAADSEALPAELRDQITEALNSKGALNDLFDESGQTYDPNVLY